MYLLICLIVCLFSLAFICRWFVYLPYHVLIYYFFIDSFICLNIIYAFIYLLTYLMTYVFVLPLIYNLFICLFT